VEGRQNTGGEYTSVRFRVESELTHPAFDPAALCRDHEGTTSGIPNTCKEGGRRRWSWNGPKDQAESRGREQRRGQPLTRARTTSNGVEVETRTPTSRRSGHGHAVPDADFRRGQRAVRLRHSPRRWKRTESLSHERLSEESIAIPLHDSSRRCRPYHQVATAPVSSISLCPHRRSTT
jgi:hypothetical protein